MNWFTADSHYNHFNIIDHTRRPFWSWQDMNKVLIERHNSRVAPHHNVFIIGDFKFGANGSSVYDLCKELNGNKIFIRGNHDKNNGLNVIMESAIIKTYGKMILLVHKPDDAELIMAGGGIDMAFVGHVHGNWKFKKAMVNVGVDVWDYYPVDAKQILKAYYNWELGKDDGKWKKC